MRSAKHSIHPSSSVIPNKLRRSDQSAGVDSLSEGLIREMIQNIPNPDYDISDYIRRSGYCADHFRRCFKKATGQTPNAYLIQLRIENARRLLNQCAHSNFGFTIKEIAAESGFQDSHYFSSMFKKVTGMTPREYQTQPTPDSEPEETTE